MSAGIAGDLAMGVSVDLSVDVRGRFRGKSVGVFVDVSVGVSVGVAVGASVDVSVGNCCFAVVAAVGIAVEIAVEVDMASATGLHGVPLLATRHPMEARGMPVEARRKSAVARGVSAVVRGTPWTWPWKAVEVSGQCRGAPPKRQIMCCKCRWGTTYAVCISSSNRPFRVYGGFRSVPRCRKQRICDNLGRSIRDPCRGVVNTAFATTML